MADNVAITAGTGTTIATDEVSVQTTNGLGHVQFVKLVDGTLNGTDAIPGTTASGLLVNTELPAAAALADATANPTTPSVGTFLHHFNGATWDRKLGSAAGTGNAASVATVWTLTALDGLGTMWVYAATWGVATVLIEGSVDGTNFFTLNLVTPSTGAIVTSITASGNWQVDIGGLKQVRARCSAFTSGTNTVTGRADSGGSAVVSLENPLPAGTNIVGALSANQSVNVAQVNGVATTTGIGVAGTGVQRVAVASDSSIVLATGAAAIGKLTANTGVIIGDVNVVSEIPGVAATSLGKAEDAVAATGDTGVMMLGIRTDTPATTTNASGDYHPPLIDANGALWTHPIQASFRIEVDSAGLTIATTAYVSGDHAGTVNTFAAAARVTGWGGVITGAALVDKSLKVSTIAVELWLFQSSPVSPGADNAVLTFADTDMSNFVGIINFDSGNWKATALNAVNSQQNLSLGYTSAATSLFGFYVLRGVPSGGFFSAVGDLRVSLQMLRD